MARRLLCSPEMGDPRQAIGELMRRATTLRREILVVAAVLVAADGVAATECIELLGHPTMRMGFALAVAAVVVVGSSVFGLRLERELVGVRGAAIRVLAGDD